MYICNRCKCRFEEDEIDIVIERHGLDTPPYEKRAVCPYCGTDDFEEFYEDELEDDDE